MVSLGSMNPHLDATIGCDIDNSPLFYRMSIVILLVQPFSGQKGRKYQPFMKPSYLARGPASMPSASEKDDPTLATTAVLRLRPRSCRSRNVASIPAQSSCTEMAMLAQLSLW